MSDREDLAAIIRRHYATGALIAPSLKVICVCGGNDKTIIDHVAAAIIAAGWVPPEWREADLIAAARGQRDEALRLLGIRDADFATANRETARAMNEATASREQVKVWMDYARGQHEGYWTLRNQIAGILQLARLYTSAGEVVDLLDAALTDATPHVNKPTGTRRSTP